MASGIPATIFVSVLFALIGCLAVGQAAYVNNWDKPASFSCPTGKYLSRITSYHDNGKEDRRWMFACTGSGATQGCTLSAYVNAFDEPVAFMCPGNSVMTGVNSYHHNHYEDRRFQFRCCTIPGKRTINCYITNWVNYWDQYMNFNVPHQRILKGAFSYHQNHQEDRRWRFIVCSLS